VSGFLILLVILGAVWLLFVLPARRRQRSHAGMQEAIELGDEIITAGGLHAIVRELGDEQLKVEIAPNVVATLDRRAVAAVAREIDVEVEVEQEPQAELEPESEPDPGDGGERQSADESPPKPG
jgi:preprotein translocase subunit YajC